jgi:hypothetical protein
MLIRHPSRLHTADDGQEPQAGTAPAPVETDATPPAGTMTDAAPAAADAPTLTPAEARALKNEAQNLRKRLRELEATQAEAERAKLSETERKDADLKATADRAAALAAEVRGYRLRDAIEAAVGPATLPPEGSAEPQANPLHGISPKLAARLIDAEALEVDDAGQFRPSALRKALAALAAEYPEIRAAASSEAAPRPAHAPQRAAAQGSVRANPAGQFISSRYTALPPNVTKR